MDLSTQQVEFYWEKACLELKSTLSPAVYNTWISTNPATNIKDNTDTAVVQVTCSTAFHAANLEKNLNNQIAQALELVMKKKVSVVYQVGDAKRAIAHATPTAKTAAKTGGELFSQNVIDETEKSRVQWKAHQIGLNPQFSFTTFAVSSGNEMAHAAAMSVAKNPSGAYNPLFLYGDVGVGKTHLMHAIGNEILLNQPETTIIYCTAEDFTNEIVQAIQTKKASGFKFKFRSAKVLLLDDIQFIAGKNAVQEEFFHTFNALIKQSAQIVITSDRPPSEISLLEKRLKSRFEAGLMIDIGKPTFELRTAILLLKAKQAHIELTIDMAKLVAQKILSAREIEGFITRVRSELELNKRQINMDLISKIIEKSQTHQQRPNLNPTQVINFISKHYGIKPLELRGHNRIKHFVKPRHVAMYILNQDVGLPLTEIARWFSHRDHTSVLHGVKKIQEELLDSAPLQQEIIEIRNRLCG